MSWWGEKVGQAPVAPAPQQLPQRVPPALLPPGIGTDPSRALAHYLQQQGVDPVTAANAVAVAAATASAPPSGEHYEGELSFNDRLIHARTKAGDETCPACGSVRYITPTFGSVMTESGRQVAPRTVCADCGHTNDPMMERQGTLAYSAKPIGQAQSARGSSEQGSWVGFSEIQKVQ